MLGNELRAASEKLGKADKKRLKRFIAEKHTLGLNRYSERRLVRAVCVKLKGTKRSGDELFAELETIAAAKPLLKKTNFCHALAVLRLCAVLLLIICAAAALSDSPDINLNGFVLKLPAILPIGAVFSGLVAGISKAAISKSKIAVCKRRPILAAIYAALLFCMMLAARFAPALPAKINLLIIFLTLLPLAGVLFAVELFGDKKNQKK